MKKLFLLFFIWLYPSIGFSTINEYKTDVYFANGIFTIDGAAKDNAFLLKLSIIEKYGNTEYKRRIGEVGYSYNQTEGFWDVIESFFQKADWDGALR